MMKRSERVEAIRLRRSGVSYSDITKRLSVAKSTVWRWLKAEELVETSPQRLTELKRVAQRKGAAAVKAKYLANTNAILREASRAIGHLSHRDLWMIGTALYWAEGSKQKPHHIAQRVVFTNSDPAMVQLFLIWLREVCQVSDEQLTFELCIHESGDLGAAQRFWASALHVPPERFRIRLKRHTRTPHRRNIGNSYVGLVRVTVSQSAALNRKIQGWINGIVQGVGESANGKPSDFGSEYPGSIPGSPVFNGAMPGNQEMRHTR